MFVHLPVYETMKNTVYYGISKALRLVEDVIIIKSFTAQAFSIKYERGAC